MCKLQKTRSVKDYIKKFQNLSLRVDTITEEKLNNLFLGGLKDNLRHEVHMFCPNSINESFILAHKVEEKFLIPRKQGANVTRDKGYSTLYLP